jgi:iron complex outermembrane recepter protein
MKSIFSVANLNKQGKIILIFLFFIISLTSKAQYSISGQVVNKSNGPIEFVTVVLLKDSLEAGSFITNSNGFYKIPNLERGNYSLNFSYLKYEKQRISFTLKEDTIINLQMINQSVKLDEITLLSKKPTIERDGDRFIFTPLKILTEGSNALDLIRIAPLIKYNQANDVFSIIGKEGTIVYINNKRSEMPKEMIIQLLRSLPAENIKNIEIITNPGSEYAANTSGGIININIKRFLYEGWRGNLALQTVQGYYNTTILNGSVNYRKGKIALQIIPFINNSFNFSTSENTLSYKNGIRNTLHNRSKRTYLVLGGGLTLDYTINKKNFLSYNGWFSNVNGKTNISNITDFSTIYKSAIDSIFSSPITGKDSYTYNFGNINYHHDFDLTGKASIDFNLDYNNFRQEQNFDGTFNKLKPGGDIELTKYRNNLPQDFFNLSERAEYGLQLPKNARLTIGVQNSYTKVNNDLSYFNWIGSDLILDNNLSNNFRYKESYWSGYTSISKRFNKKWSTRFGIRVESTNYSTEKKNLNIKNDSSYINFFPSLSIGYVLNPNNQFGLSFSRKIIRPSWELLFPGRIYNNNNYFTENNPFLQPSLQYNSELSYTLNKMHSFILRYSHIKNNYANFILPVTEDNVTKLKNTYVNYGYVNTATFLLNLNKTYFKGFHEVTITPTLSYRQFKAKNNLTNFTEIKNYYFDLVIDNTFYLSTKKKWTAFLTFNYTSKRKTISSAVLNDVSSITLIVRKVVKNFSFSLILDDIYNGSSKIKYDFYSNFFLTQNIIDRNNYNQIISFRVRYQFGNNQVKANKNRSNANDEFRQRTKG